MPGTPSARGGTLAYAPPEQFAGEPASPAGDVYAATATFFECLTGRPPFARGYRRGADVPAHGRAGPGRTRCPSRCGRWSPRGWPSSPPTGRPTRPRSPPRSSQVAAQAYGPRWYQRGRSHLGEAALLLAALWPTASRARGPGRHGGKDPLRPRHLGSRLRHASAVKKTIAAGIVVAVAGGGTYAAIALTRPLSILSRFRWLPACPRPAAAPRAGAR